MVKFSVVIPIHNEEGAISGVYYSLQEVMSGIGEAYEIIFVDDGSHDKSLEVLQSLQDAKNRDLRVIALEEHLGQAKAMQAGFTAAKGAIIITIDGDGQFDPRDIPKLLKKLNQGYDVVCGFRDHRIDPWTKIISAKIANMFRRVLIGEKIHDVGSTFRAYRSETVKNLDLTKEKLILMTAILLKKGYRIGEVKVSHYPRTSGASKYNIKNRLFTGLSGILKVIKLKK